MPVSWGTDDKGQPYTLTTREAWQDPDEKDIVNLEDVEGDMLLDSGAWFAISSVTGRYDQSTQILTLHEDVSLYTDQGYELHTEKAEFDLEAGNGWSDEAGIRPRSVRSGGCPGFSNHTGRWQTSPGRTRTHDPLSGPHAMTRRFAIVVAAVLAGTGAAFAQVDDVADSIKHDTSLPIAISADAMEVEQESQRAIFLGAVDVEQGDIELKAERLVVYYRDKEAEDDNAIYKIEVEGNVRFSTPNESAQGDSGIYNVDDGTIRLVGNVVLTSAQSVIRGSEAIMNLETGKSEVLGQAGGDGRVEGLFVPDKSGETEPSESEAP